RRVLDDAPWSRIRIGIEGTRVARTGRAAFPARLPRRSNADQDQTGAQVDYRLDVVRRGDGRKPAESVGSEAPRAWQKRQEKAQSTGGTRQLIARGRR